jgi:hydrogenase nickel incorporation protein HypB
MCATCGCGDDQGVRVSTLDHEHPREHPHEHPHEHPQPHEHPHPHPEQAGSTRTIDIEAALLARNDSLAADNRRWLAGRAITAVNLMSSPGSGKTSLLQRTITETATRRPVAVIEGDQETLLDAERIRQTGAAVVQVNTGAGCHLDADMLRRGLDALNPPRGCLVFVENVGNLVCPALFDLGEVARVVVVSVTEGEDKPLKYPHMFAAADVVVVNKVDLLPYVDVDLGRLSGYVRQVNPRAEILALSVTRGDGLEQWYRWLDRVPT